MVNFLKSQFSLPSNSFQSLNPPILHIGGHLQTILAAKCSSMPYESPNWQRERWEWVDNHNGEENDFCDADWLHPKHSTESTPILVLFHGLEGSSNSHYARSIAGFFKQKNWRVVVPHFRGCSGEPNRLLRAYHSGDTAEIGRMLHRVHIQFPKATIYAAGISLGGNALLCYLSDLSAQQIISKKSARHSLPLQAAASICAPLDLALCDQALSQGFSKIYTWLFLRTLHAKAKEKRRRFPNACNWDKVLSSQTLFEFDNYFTAPVHGYHNANDYYTRASAQSKIHTIHIPTLLINPKNDPFVPSNILDSLTLSPHTVLEQPDQGGHVGFAVKGGHWNMGELTWLPFRLYEWFTQTHKHNH